MTLRQYGVFETLISKWISIDAKSEQSFRDLKNQSRADQHCATM